MTMTTPIIKLNNVSKSYTATPILKNLLLEINTGEMILIKGPSGSGKSTLLRIIAGLEIPDTGEVFVQDQLASNPTVILPPFDRGVGYLFQDLALWPHLTALEQLQLVARENLPNSANIAWQISEVCRNTGFPEELIDRLPHQLSRGERQRLAVARTIIHQPPIWLLDEPFTALDIDIRNLLAKLLTQTHMLGKITIIVVSHDLMMEDLNYDRRLFLRDATLTEGS